MKWTSLKYRFLVWRERNAEEIAQAYEKFKRERQTPHKWFAWYPVPVSWHHLDEPTTVWLETVWRRDMHGYWVYTMVKPREDKDG